MAVLFVNSSDMYRYMYYYTRISGGSCGKQIMKTRSDWLAIKGKRSGSKCGYVGCVDFSTGIGVSDS